MERQVKILATLLQRRGHSVSVFAPQRPDLKADKDWEFNMFRHATYIDDNVIDCLDGSAPIPGSFFGLGALVRREHERSPFDLFFACSAYRYGNIALGLRRLYGKPVVLRTHGADINMVPETNYGWRLDPKKALLIEQSIGEADHCIAISGSVVELQREIRGSAGISRIWNGVDVEKFAPRRDFDANAQGEGPATGILVGRNVPKKQFGEFLVAFSKSEHLKEKLKLRLVGEGVTQLAPLCREHDITANVELIEGVEADAMPELYRSADLFIMPSRMETFGTVTVEAMASGLPVVGLDAPGTADQVVDGETGYLAPTLDEMARRVEELVDTPVRMRSFGAAGRQRAIDWFSWDAVAAQYEAVFEKAIESFDAPVRLNDDTTIENYERGKIRLMNFSLFLRDIFLYGKKRYVNLIDCFKSSALKNPQPSDLAA